MPAAISEALFLLGSYGELAGALAVDRCTAAGGVVGHARQDSTALESTYSVVFGFI